MRPGSATLPRPSTLSNSAPVGIFRNTSSGGPTATIRSADTAIEAGEWTRSSPVPAGVTAEARSWIRREMSAIGITFESPRHVQYHLQLVCIHKRPATPREEGGCEFLGNYLWDGPCRVRICGKKGLHETGAPTVTSIGAGNDERDQGDNVRFGGPDQDVCAMVEVEGLYGRDRPREGLR